jgi:hypothetical protein
VSVSPYCAVQHGGVGSSAQAQQDTVDKSKGGRGVKSELSVSGFALRLGKTKGLFLGLFMLLLFIKRCLKATVFKKVSAQADGLQAARRWVRAMGEWPEFLPPTGHRTSRSDRQG